MIKSFYNPDDQQNLEYHKELLKLAERERLVSQAVRADRSHDNRQKTWLSLFERLQCLFNSKPRRSELAYKQPK